MSGMLTGAKNEKPEWIRPVHTIRVWIPSQPPASSAGSSPS